MGWRRDRRVWLVRKMRMSLLMVTRRKSQRIGDDIVFEGEGEDALEGEWSHRRVV
jgi:hypothetical protein